ncbi:hypothetical protein [Cytobacillus gottheilii]|uniref:Uncharacterized protein n=1 Tax=Cytobacillus gottheilii TaxID=859144 RepID=A0ABX8FIY0_9BACI|nr:hypothetical protein [Cytobacillus gottheilii]QVY63923.1 hypothetical protein J1899_07925 [Cytobacillus gottheilii]
MADKFSKYPVKTDIGEYKVDIIDTHVAFGLRQWVVRIFTKNERKTFFNRRKFILMYEVGTAWRNYEEFAVDLVGLAKSVVKRYEDEVAAELKFDQDFKVSIKLFNDWDGDAR